MTISLERRIGFGSAFGTTCLMNAMAWYVMFRTKRTPRLNRFLATGLMSLHILCNCCLIGENIVSGTIAESIFIRLGRTCLIMTYLTIAIMGIERMIVFTSSRFYLRYIIYSRTRNAVAIFWIVYAALSFGLMNTCDKISKTCPLHTRLEVFIVGGLSMLISYITNIKIFLILRKSLKNPCEGLVLWKDIIVQRGAGLTFAFLVTSTIPVIVLAIGIFTPSVGDYELQYIFTGMELFNSVVDSCIYVFWFKECRMEILKMCSKVFPVLENRVEAMRMDVFNIVVAERVAGHTRPVADTVAGPSRQIDNSCHSYSGNGHGSRPG